MGAPPKIVTREELSRFIEIERAAGRTTAMANGLFDLLHVGHVRYLEAASGEADILIVGVNSDDSARHLKGPGRPVLPSDERAEIVAALGCVDWVFLFDEPNAEATLRMLHPDVHCKGTDYTPESVPERETVLAYGGRIAIVGDPKQHATRDLIREIASRFRAVPSKDPVSPWDGTGQEGEALRGLLVRLPELPDVPVDPGRERERQFHALVRDAGRALHRLRKIPRARTKPLARFREACRNALDASRALARAEKRIGSARKRLQSLAAGVDAGAPPRGGSDPASGPPGP